MALIIASMLAALADSPALPCETEVSLPVTMSLRKNLQEIVGVAVDDAVLGIAMSLTPS
ncbi:MAG: hypothetical protein R3D01_04560 [Hyphomicrobiales bacterium]